jgi:hypothetical protein
LRNERPSGLIRGLGRLLPAALRSHLRDRFFPPPRKNPRYIPAELGIEGVATRLRERNVRYVVLRWFEDLPEIREGGDLDLLVHDDDCEALDAVLDGPPTSIQCDVYTVSGLPGSAYSGVPHLPPAKAANLLARATSFKELYRVPAPEDHFLSLAFHAIYHKGARTGLPTSFAELVPLAHPINDYPGTLQRLAQQLGLDVSLDLETLDKFLVEQGWAPTPEMIPVFRRRNAWAALRFAPQVKPDLPPEK